MNTWNAAALWSLGISAVFGIFTLALVPLLAQQVDKARSIYAVPVKFHVLRIPMTMYLTQAFRPQHAAFIAGIIFYCLGTSDTPGLGLWVGLGALVVVLISKPRADAGVTAGASAGAR